MRAIRAGDERAAGPLYKSLRPSVEFTISTMLRSRPPEFEDLMQVTFERVVRGVVAGTFEGRSQLKTWAKSIAAHVTIDYLRARTREQRLLQPLDAASAATQAFSVLPERSLEARSELLKIQGVLGRMKPEAARILVLHDVLGHSILEVAELLSIEVSTAQSRVRRARLELIRRCTPTSKPTRSGESEFES